MYLSDFDYLLPKELIAQQTLPNRDESRMMVLRENGNIEHKSIRDLPEFFRSGDLLVLNDTRVLPARLIGQKETGGKVECLVLPALNGRSEVKSLTKEALIRGSNVRPGTRLFFRSQNNRDPLKAVVLEKISGAKYQIQFQNPADVESFGSLPLPPYIKSKLDDPNRYQTIYANEQGSLAAPTAGLHFTESLMQKLKSQGVEFVTLTLHVGIGTFAPIRTEKLGDWEMHAEYYKVSAEAAEKLNTAIQSGKRIFAVGTTSVRTLETVTQNKQVCANEGWTNIFIYPGYSFKFPYAGMLTNFHLPKSSLILLASAFAGKEKLFKAYHEAIAKRYRFYSLGDAMLIFH